MTVFPAPVARLTPNRRFPSEIAFRHASTHSSWYGRSEREGAGVVSAKGGISLVMSFILGAFFRGLTTFIEGSICISIASVTAAVSMMVSSVLLFFGRPLLRGAELSASTFSVACRGDEWNC
jgi:hypothetical protein